MNIFKKFFNKKQKEQTTKGKFEIKSAYYENGQIIVETDWDDEFIEVLKQNGYTGSDEQIIQKYMVYLNKQVLLEMGEIDNNDFI